MGLYKVRYDNTDSTANFFYSSNDSSHALPPPFAPLTHLVLNVGLLCPVQVHLDKPAAVKTDTNPLPNDLCREDQVLQHGVVYRGEGSAAGAELFLLGPLVPLGFW